MRDENTGQSEKPIQVARKNLRLMVKSEVREGTSALRVARVQRTQAGSYQLVRIFIPPLVDFQASEHLVSIVRRLVEILAAKSSELAGNRRQKNQALANFTASDIASFWLLYTINSNFPLLNHFFQAGQGASRAGFQYHAWSGWRAHDVLRGNSAARSAQVRPR